MPGFPPAPATRGPGFQSRTLTESKKADHPTALAREEKDAVLQAAFDSEIGTQDEEEPSTAPSHVSSASGDGVKSQVESLKRGAGLKGDKESLSRESKDARADPYEKELEGEQGENGEEEREEEVATTPAARSTTILPLSNSSASRHEHEHVHQHDIDREQEQDYERHPSPDEPVPSAPRSSVRAAEGSITSPSESEYDPSVVVADIAIVPPPPQTTTSIVAAASGSTTSLTSSGTSTDKNEHEHEHESTTSSAGERMRKVLGPPAVPERRSSYASVAVSEGGGDYYTPMGMDDLDREEILSDRKGFIGSGLAKVDGEDGEADEVLTEGAGSGKALGGVEGDSQPFGFMGLGPSEGLAPPLLTTPSAYGLPSGTSGNGLETIRDDEDDDNDGTGTALAPAPALTVQTPSKSPTFNSISPTSPPPAFSALNNSTSRARSNSNRSQSDGNERGANLKAWWRGFKARTGSQSGGTSGGLEGGQKGLAALAEPKSQSGGTSGGAQGGQKALALLAEPRGLKGKEPNSEHSVFAIPLTNSLEIASVQISTSGPKGELYVWGFIPVVVAKCGSHLKSTATEVEGTFRVSGSAKRMKDLQAIFDGPPKYGKDLEWKNTTFTTHDVATILRRYLTQMPEPIIPYDLYYHFRDMLSNPEVDAEEAIRVFKELISRMPKPNQYLLIYVLDLLSVFARKSDTNLMTATNLAVIFQPGIISHPSHDMAPAEHGLSQKVLIFLIEHQDSFMLGMNLDPIQPKTSEPSGTSTHSSSSQSHSLSPAPQSSSPAPVQPLPLSPLITASSVSSPLQVITTDSPVIAPVQPESTGPTPHAVLISSPRAGATGASRIGPPPVVAPRPPPPPPPERSAPGEMLPSDSDSEDIPQGGYYVKSSDPTSLLRSKTVTARRPRTAGNPPATGLGIALATSTRKRVDKPAPKIIIVDNPQEPAAGYGMAHPTPYKRPVKKEPVMQIHDNPPFQVGGLSRRKTAPTKRGERPVRTSKEKQSNLPARPGKTTAPTNAEAP